MTVKIRILRKTNFQHIDFLPKSVESELFPTDSLIHTTYAVPRHIGGEDHRDSPIYGRNLAELAGLSCCGCDSATSRRQGR